jgi:serpin B
MKRILPPILFLAVFINYALPTWSHAQERSTQESVVQSGTEFAVDLYRVFADNRKNTGKNLFFSPYSIYTVLALMYGGAAGETAEEMAEALHVEIDSKDFQASLADVQSILNEIRQRGQVDLNIAISLWPQSGAELNPEFLQLAERSRAELFPVDYRREAEEVRGRINYWAEKNTGGRIEKIVNWNLHPETHLLLANAIFFKGDWARRFDEAHTKTAPFHLLDGHGVDVPMMMQLGRFPYVITDHVQVLRLPYEGGDLSMTIVLPRDPLDLTVIEEHMSAQDIASLQEGLSEEKVYVHLPRFQITSAFDLIEDESLRALGINRALSILGAEFPGIARPANWFSIQIFVHKAFIEVNEEGTEAAAVTVGGCFPTGTQVPTPEGLLPIEVLESGSAVYAFDLSKGEWTTARVAVRSTYPFSGAMVTIRAAGDTIEATWNHPFLVMRGKDLEDRRVPMDLPSDEALSTARGRWVEARDIREGDVLLNRTGGTAVVTGISSRRELSEVFALEIDGFHNHAVGLKGILVHNGSKKGSAEEISEFIADHPFLFFISDELTGSILFVGRIMDPSDH